MEGKIMWRLEEIFISLTKTIGIEDKTIVKVEIRGAKTTWVVRGIKNLKSPNTIYFLSNHELQKEIKSKSLLELAEKIEETLSCFYMEAVEIALITAGLLKVLSGVEDDFGVEVEKKGNVLLFKTGGIGVIAEPENVPPLILKALTGTLEGVPNEVIRRAEEWLVPEEVLEDLKSAEWSLKEGKLFFEGQKTSGVVAVALDEALFQVQGFDQEKYLFRVLSNTKLDGIEAFIFLRFSEWAKDKELVFFINEKVGAETISTEGIKLTIMKKKALLLCINPDKVEQKPEGVLGELMSLMERVGLKNLNCFSFSEGITLQDQSATQKIVFDRKLGAILSMSLNAKGTELKNIGVAGGIWDILKKVGAVAGEKRVRVSFDGEDLTIESKTIRLSVRMRDEGEYRVVAEGEISPDIISGVIRVVADEDLTSILQEARGILGAPLRVTVSVKNRHIDKLEVEKTPARSVGGTTKKTGSWRKKRGKAVEEGAEPAFEFT